jgi:hypothetical protein
MIKEINEAWMTKNSSAYDFTLALIVSGIKNACIAVTNLP